MLAFSKLLKVIFFALQSLFCIQGVFVILPLSVDLGISSAWDEAVHKPTQGPVGGALTLVEGLEALLGGAIL